MINEEQEMEAKERIQLDKETINERDAHLAKDIGQMAKKGHDLVLI